MIDAYRLVGPLLLRLPPETAHALALRALKAGLVPAPAVEDEPALACRVFGLDFPNPVGLAAGFDKDADSVDALLGQGFGFVEVGTVTPRPQAGNPRPRVFRLVEDEALVNRLGFNSGGLEVVARRLAAGRRRGIVGVNIGMNRGASDAVADYVRGARAFAAVADYLAINVSSPNTPGLRELQGREALSRLLREVRQGLAEFGDKQPPLLVKIAPDLGEGDRRDIAEVALEQGVNGMIVGNTTIARPPGLRSPHAGEVGGLSGRPLFAPSTAVLGDMYRLTEGRLPLVGVGGVSDGHDAYAKIRAGASLVQLYTALVYRGPGLVARIRRELAGLLRADGFDSVAEAVGADHRGSPVPAARTTA